MTAYTSIFNTPPSGSNYLIGDTVTLTGGDVWKYAGNGQWVADARGQMQVAAIGTPFVILPGDGAAVGMFFTGTAGAFTLSAAILTNAWNALKGCWCYLPANFGGKTYPADWYWAVFSSDTAGILYTDTYETGVPHRPASPTPFPGNLTGWLTQTTSEVTGPTGFTYPGGSMGPSGILKTHIRVAGNNTGTKTFRQYLDSTQIGGISPSTSPITELITSCINIGSESIQTNSPTTSPTGVGIAGSSFGTLASTIDTSSDKTLSFSLQLSGNTACAILLHADVTVTYGA